LLKHIFNGYDASTVRNDLVKGRGP